MNTKNTKMNIFEDFSKFDVYDKNNGIIDKTVIDEEYNAKTSDEVVDYTYTIVSSDENYVVKISLYNR